jgi:hypothetical protein
MQNISKNDVGLCPICKINYISEDEVVCSTCSADSDLSDEELHELYGGTQENHGNDDATENESDGDDELIPIEEEEFEIMDISGIDNGEAVEEEEPEEKNSEEESEDDDFDDDDESFEDEDEDDEEDEDEEDDDYEDD